MAKGKQGNNIQMIMQQAQRMQVEMEKRQKELEVQEFEGSSGGGMVSCVCNGAKIIQRMSIKPEVIDPDDIEMLEDLIVSAVNTALDTADKAMAEALNEVTSSVPGMR